MNQRVVADNCSPHRSGRAGSAASGSSTDWLRYAPLAYPLVQEVAGDGHRHPYGLSGQPAIRCRDVETGPQPRCVGRLSLQRCHLPVPPSLHAGLVGSMAARFGGTMRHSDSSPPIPPRFVAFESAVPSEHLRFAPIGQFQVRPSDAAYGLGEPVPAPRRSLRWRRRGLPGSRGNPPARMPRASTPARSLPPRPLRSGDVAFRPTHRRRPSHSMHFGAQSRGPTGSL